MLCFFESESGIQRWHLKDENGILSNVVIGDQAFQTPNNIHRKDFYKSNPRRIIQKDQIKDTRFKWNKTNVKHEFKTLIREELLLNFKRRLDEELLP